MEIKRSSRHATHTLAQDNLHQQHAENAGTHERRKIALLGLRFVRVFESFRFSDLFFWFR